MTSQPTTTGRRRRRPANPLLVPIVKTDMARRILGNDGTHLTPHRECWGATTTDDQWRFERLDEPGTPWELLHQPTRLGCGWYGTLKAARVAVGSGDCWQALADQLVEALEQQPFGPLSEAGQARREVLQLWRARTACQVRVHIPDPATAGGMLVVDVTGSAAVDVWPPKRAAVQALAAAEPWRIRRPGSAAHHDPVEVWQQHLDDVAPSALHVRSWSGHALPESSGWDPDEQPG